MSWHPLPPEVYALVEQTPATVLLETSKPGSHSTSQLFIDPLRVLEAHEAADLHGLFAQIEKATAAGYFAAGFFSYECGQFFEPKVAPRFGATIEPTSHPLAWFGIYRRSHRFDHATGAFVDGDPPALANFRNQNPTPQSLRAVALDILLGITEQQFSERIEQVHEWIRAGDVYQLNFTFPMQMQCDERPAALYERLRRRQPVEYGAFLHCVSGRHILCFSPELFFRIGEEGPFRRITTQPMKGTTRRGRTTAEDRQFAEWLCNDIKNRSENVMIVDLIRNDLGRLCNYGSVRVESLFDVERFASLWQMTSTVTGELRPETSFEEIFRSLFPCGSITGAPKVRAMQLLQQIEDRPRGIYTGAIGFFSRESTVFNVAIRTLDLEADHASMGVGGGIVIDSIAAAEFRECQLKAEFLARTEEPFSLIESLLWQQGYPFIELHLDRLEDSSCYFDFSCDRAEVRAALLEVANSFPDEQSRKVRLLLNPDGSLHIEHEVIPEILGVEGLRIGRVRISSQRIDPDDRFYYHKTTQRAQYDRAWKAAKEAGYDDALFFNTRGEVTEGAVNNIFVEKDGRLFTAPVSCGLLPGIYRRHLLETRSDVVERILYVHDLETADAIYLTNAVRGLRPVTIDWQS